MTTPVVGRPLTQVALSEAKRNWPFMVGFGVTLSLVFTLATSLDPKDGQKSKFINPNAHWYVAKAVWRKCGDLKELDHQQQSEALRSIIVTMKIVMSCIWGLRANS